MNYTQRLQNTIQHAEALAAQHHHSEITPAHLLYAAVQQRGAGKAILERSGVNSSELEKRLERAVAQLPTQSKGESPVPRSTSVSQAFEHAQHYANEREDHYLGTEHIVASILAVEPELFPECVTRERYQEAHIVLLGKNEPEEKSIQRTYVPA